MRVLGLDYGSVRIGLALSDPSGTIAGPLEVYRRRSLPQDLAELKQIVRDREIELVVVGLPRNMNGTEGPQAAETREFVQQLRAEIDCPVDLWDERLSSVIAERAMLEAGLSRARRKQKRDKVAACVILQGYLDRYRNKHKPTGL